MNMTPLVSAEDLAAALERHEPIVLVDCRHVLADAAAGERAWRESHLPGAGHAHLDRDLSDHSRLSSEGRHPLPDAAAFRAVLARLGVQPQSQVVAYDAGDGAMAAARFWWMLRLLGHPHVAVLDGGYARWSQLGLPLESGAPTIEPGDYRGEFELSSIAGADEILARGGDAPGWLLDARAPERFRGEVEPLDKRAGHIPGAVNRPYSANLEGGRFRPAADLRREFTDLIGARPASDVVLSCGSGVTACHNLLAMEHAGLHGARIYAGSWSGWIDDPARPVATGP